jgi:hypothetical protein
VLDVTQVGVLLQAIHYLESTAAVAFHKQLDVTQVGVLLQAIHYLEGAAAVAFHKPRLGATSRMPQAQLVWTSCILLKYGVAWCVHVQLGHSWGGVVCACAAGPLMV